MHKTAIIIGLFIAMAIAITAASAVSKSMQQVSATLVNPEQATQ